MGNLTGASSSGDASTEGTFTSYLNSMFVNSHGMSKIGTRNMSELRMLAAGLDHLKAGELGKLADVLSSRMKAVETAAIEGSWDIAKHLDLTNAGRVSLATQSEIIDAPRHQLLALKLADARKKLEKDKNAASAGADGA